MDNFIKEGEQMLENQGNNNNNNQNQGNDNNNNNQSNNQQQGNNNSGGGGFMSGLKQNTEDSYINNEVNSFLSKEGVPSGADGAIDGVLDTEVNKYT